MEAKLKKDRVDDEDVFVPDSLGGLSDMVQAAIDLAEKTNRNIALCFNGTIVTVAPGSNVVEALANWDRTRRYQYHS